MGKPAIIWERAFFKKIKKITCILTCRKHRACLWRHLPDEQMSVSECGPGALHPPDAERVTQTLTGHVTAAGGQLVVGLVAP